MSGNSRKRNLTVIITTAICCVIFACQVFPPGIDLTYEEEISSSDVNFTFDPTSILAELAEGNPDVFFPQKLTPETDVPVSSEPVHWKQMDYIQIADAFFHEAWGEDSENAGWSISHMLFKMSCEYSEEGPQFASIEYFKVTNELKDGKRYVRTINIFPLENSIVGFEQVLRPILYKWQSVDVLNLKITADDAFKIAEINGGKEVRSQVGNDCTITISIAPNGLYEGWRVRYKGDDPVGLLEVYVNEYTGEFETNLP